MKLSPLAMLAIGAIACSHGPARQDSEIVGGQNANIVDLPWQVSLQDDQGHLCGGSIVRADWVVTAQHCVEFGSPAEWRVVAGVSRLSRADEAQVRGVADVAVAPGYTDPTQGKDLALLQLDEPLDLGWSSVEAIGIVGADAADDGATDPGTPATVSGWGALDPDDFDLPDKLQKVTIPIVSNADAADAYGLPIGADQLSAGLLGVGGKDACQGDSGGPLVVTGDGGEKLLAGVVSWGESCAEPDYPGMYARVSAFEPFIRSHIGDEPPPPVARLVINEILADPPAGYDANGDGKASTTQDELIELVNVGDAAIDLSAAAVADSTAVRGSFPLGTVLAPGEGLVLFGGGKPAAIADVKVLVVGALSLNNGGDKITITAPGSDDVIATVQYGAQGGADQSLVRSPELDPDAPLVKHRTVSDAPASPGTRADGSPL